MTAARILAAGGLTSSALTMLAGFMVCPALLGIAGAVMLAANALVLIGAGRRA